MKNNIFFITIIILLFFFKNAHSEQFEFETSDIEIVDGGNIVYASNGKAISIKNNLEIQAQKFEYFREKELLIAFDGTATLKLENLKIEFNKITIDQKKFLIIAKNNVKIIDIDKKITFESNSIIFDQKSKILTSKTDSILKDKYKNNFLTKSFEYNLNDNILKIAKAKFFDQEKNKFEIDLAYINTVSNKLFGKDVTLNLNNKSFNKDNEPRLKGRSITHDNNITEISKGVFTTCKKRDKCPPWELSAEKIKHDKKNQEIKYKNAWLKVYDIPVVYFPKFFHPDPTVDRKSGFLIPSLKNSPNSSGYLSLPYYKVISENKDFTFTPRLFLEDKLLLQTEYRQKNKNSSHIGDLGYFFEKDKDSKSHLFYKLNKQIDLLNFDNSTFDLKVERTSNDTYLKRNKLNSPLISNTDVLENSLNFNMSRDDLSINTELRSYESLDKEKSDRYEFILPKIDIIKKFTSNDLNGDLYLSSSNFITNYETNIFEKVNINNLVYNSDPKISNLGFYNNFDFLVKNVNSDTQNSSNYKKNTNNYISSLFQLNSNMPLIKESNSFQNILKPKLSLKISPNNTKDISSNETRLDVNNLFNLERTTPNDTVEGGISLAYGNDFSIFDKRSSIEIFSLKLANNLRFEDNEDLPSTSQIDQKTSNFFGEIAYTPNTKFNTKYSFSRKNNLTEISHENFQTEISLNNFVTTFDYLNENNTFEKNSYLKNTTKYNFDNSNNISFSTRRNKKTNLTEYYNLIYQYKNDCLAASIEYNKDYYNDRDIKPEESVFFKLTIIPFGETSTPNLKN